MIKYPLKLIRALGTIGLVGSIGFFCWEQLAPETPQIGSQRKELADQIIPAIVEDIRQTPQRVRPIVLFHFTNDASGYFTSRLRNVTQERGVLDLTSRTLSERARNTLGLRQQEFKGRADAIEQARQLGAAGILFGQVHVFESWESGAKIDVEVTLASTSDSESLFSKRYTKATGSEPIDSPHTSDTSTTFPTLQRCVAWILLVLLLPVFSVGFIRAMVVRNSNATNAFVLGVYTLADALLAWLMVGATLTSWWIGLILATAIGIAFAYNVRIMTFAMKLEA